MNQPTITDTEQAKEFYKEHVHGCPRGFDELYDYFTPETLQAYKEHSSRELEHRWAFEEFEKYFSQIRPNNPDNHNLLEKAWKWHDVHTVPVKLAAEKLEIMLNECNGKPDKTLLKCLLETAGYNEINKDDKSEERTLVRLMELCRPFVSEEENERLRFMIVGPESEEDAKLKYRINHFSDKPDRFQTITAEQNFRRFATPENMLKWKQEYFDEWTSREYFLNKDNMQWVNVIELGALYYGIYSKENTQKLYDKLADYKNCAAVEQYRKIAFDIVSHLSKRLFEDGEYDMLERFYRLALDIFNDAPDCWEKEYFGKFTLNTIKKYRGLMGEYELINNCGEIPAEHFFKFGSGKHYAVQSGGRIILRVEVDDDEWNPFNDGIVWFGYFCLGTGKEIIAVNLENLTTLEYKRYSINGYFGRFLELNETLFAASAAGVLAFDTNMNLLWRNESLAVDGVTFGDVRSGVLEISCELDPPGGWVEKRLNILTGSEI